MSLRLSQILRHLSVPSSLRCSPSSTSLSRGAAAVTTNSSFSFPTARSTMAAPSAAIRNASKSIHTAACLIIGDEVLGGKALIEDDESQIIEAVRRMSANYDFVVTSGGIGPTHDDITYPSVAKAFGLELQLYEEAYARMRKLSRPRPSQPPIDWDVDSPELRARLRMVELPTDPALAPDQQFFFTREDLWVPVCVVNGNVHILPGVPRLFEMLLDGLKPALESRLASGKGITRVLISTPLPESLVAPYLTELAARVEPRGVKVGSYPRWNHKHNTVTLVGRDEAFIESLVPEVTEKVQGRRVSKEGEDDDLEESVEQ
ncbi:molybdopterin-binding domain containing protein [Grosmannia clavigera kw1407]|uniref:Molybdopterin-binding domain containing protein n=1 Tax=Grosmannia clavigera (strain kw1407 / UAMH 11150) TaxID=655863 RepID=F0XGU7_GROCL|nr:molybdopterin-binding domain containing protein [Grosmannia clavigera kw1407]EFX02899.1 molybdopterin-binding domain containing protein [Grosmannia clavigera kw1407]